MVNLCFTSEIHIGTLIRWGAVFELIVPEGANILSVKYIPVFLFIYLFFFLTAENLMPYIIVSSYSIKSFTDSIMHDINATYLKDAIS